MAPYGDYGELTDVYEYIGEDNNLGNAANWAKDKSAPAAEAPTAGTDIRWFGKNAYYSGSLAITAKDYFDGATLALSGDCNVSSDVVFSNTVISIATIVVSSPVVFSLYGSDMTTTRNDQWLGVYPPATYPSADDKTFINFLPGKVSSFTFTDNNINISDADSAKTDLVEPGYLKLDGAAIADADWESFFSVDVSGKTVSITYNPSIDENKISSVASSEVTATSATLTATIFSIADGASVIVACDTAAITEENVVAKGEAVAVNEGIATKSVTTLVSGNVYNYAFAIVTNGAVAAFKAASFVASDYDYVYIDGAWIGGAIPALGGASLEKVLFADDFTTAGELRVDNKKVKDSVLTSGTIIYGTLQVVNSAVVNTRNNQMNQAPYGFYGDNAKPLNFVSEGGNGTIYRASSYTCRCTAAQYNDFYSNLIESGKLLFGGESIGSELYGSRFTLTTSGTEQGTYDEVAETMNIATLTLWDLLDSTATGAWTVKDGARVKLTGNVKLDALTVEGTGAVIDLNGHTLKVPANALTVNGEVIAKGTHTDESLPPCFTNGTVEVLAGGLVLVFR